MVLVAAIAAGVLINTAGFLQSKSQETGQQSSKQVSNRLQEVATVGNVSDGDKIDWVNVTVTQAPGAGEIDLQNATVTWIGPKGTFQLTHSANFTAGDTIADGSTEYGHKVTKDSDNSAPVLNDPDDRLQMVFDVSAFTTDLGEGQEVTVKINTMAGATTTIRFSTPESLGQKRAVEL